MTADVRTSSTLRAVRTERHGWTLLPLALIAYGAGLLFLLGALSSAVILIDSFGSTGPVPLDLRASSGLPAAAGTHHYFGSAFIADGAQVVTTGVRAEVSGIDPLTRVLLRLDPLLWSATLCTVSTAVGLALARLRARRADRSAARPVLVAAVALGTGSTTAQLAGAIARTRVGHVTWDGRNGIDGFTALPPQVFDLTPIAVSVAFLAIVRVVRRSETSPSAQLS